MSAMPRHKIEPRDSRVSRRDSLFGMASLDIAQSSESYNLGYSPQQSNSGEVTRRKGGSRTRWNMRSNIENEGSYYDVRRLCFYVFVVYIAGVFFRGLCIMCNTGIEDIFVISCTVFPTIHLLPTNVDSRCSNLSFSTKCCVIVVPTYMLLVKLCYCLL